MPVGPEATLIPNVQIRLPKLDIRFPVEGTYLGGGWLYWFGKITIEGTCTLVRPGSITNVVGKGPVFSRKGFEKKVQVEVGFALTEGIRGKVEVDFAKRKPGDGPTTPGRGGPERLGDRLEPEGL